MANFIITIDANTDRRSRFIESIRGKLSPVKGLIVNTVNTGDFCAAWASTVNVPISQAVEKGRAAVIWGDPISDDMPQKVDAEQLMNLWSNPDTRIKSFFNGFYAAAVYGDDAGLAAGADLLGIYPLYYWTDNNILLVGSSPELFRYHPCFKTALNPEGLLSILLTMHIFDGQTLLKDVKRLNAGHMLTWQSGQPVKEVMQYKIRPSTDYFACLSPHMWIF